MMTMDAVAFAVVDAADWLQSADVRKIREAAVRQADIKIGERNRDVCVERIQRTLDIREVSSAQNRRDRTQQ